MSIAPRPARLPVAFIEALGAIVGEAHVRTGDAVLALHPGEHADNLNAGVVVAPADSGQVAAIVMQCRRQGVPIVPQGGRTGLVGGNISRPGEVVLSLSRMARIERLDPVERVAVVGAGATLEAVQQAAAAHGLEPGIDLPSRGSATVGGMISTNAGGIMAFRNGVMRHRVFGLEAVAGDGTLYSDLTRVVKNSAGYDLKHLFIGSEGTLGIVTKAAIKLDPLPRASATALFGLPSVAAVLEVVRLAMSPAAGELRAAEALWRPFLDVTAAHSGWSDASIDRDAPVYLLLSLGGSEEETLRQSFEALFETAVARFPDMSGVIAASMKQEADLWTLREATDAVYRRFPAAPSFDVSLPQSEIESYLDRMLADLSALDPGLTPFVFGHLADGNLHLILNRAGPGDPTFDAEIEAALYHGIREVGGSFSAEHGIGTKRVGPMAALSDPGKLRLMTMMKRTLDPDGILNPGKVLGGE